MHLEWGRPGLREAGRQADVVVVVDVLSFTTAVAVATERGVVVHPMRPGEPYAPAIARRLGAHLAGKRGAAVSLSPLTLARLPAGERVVLASPHGATLALEAAATGATVVAASLRNAAAVGAWLQGRPRRVVVIAAGESWRDGPPRTAVEDLLGAGAVLSHLPPSTLSAEARVAADAFRASRQELEAILRGCTSGRELAAQGFVDDVSCAAELDASPVVPVLVEGAFRPW
ncbi:MAG TPA: 2-phosphosulfolactate phosphatase [Acidimicrobiales bacterium]|nr:2-phosphosulfolactate phosphatase [Acidimicrobiales bacterium]